MKWDSRSLASLILAGAALAAVAADTGPDAVVQSTVTEVLSVIKHTTDKNALRQLAEQKVLSRFDFRQMTRLAMGSVWSKANAQQQQSLENGFRSLLVNTYTKSLSLGASGDIKVDVRPVRQSSQNDVTVKTLVRTSGKPPIAIDYRMEHQPGGWKVYDVHVEGVSLVTTYRSTFSEEVQRSGIDGLIKTLDAKNRTLVKS
ncbi:MAG: ABC transporter substrate-binding protein [Betaproteobacteria bacterium]|nr:ABC transporter substrate-binding protein [Betaproteobacteria bacterium]